MPFSWTQVGAFLANGPVGVGGYAPFGFGVNRAYRLDPLSLAAAPLPHTDECSLGDVAADGTIACFPLDVHQQSHSLSLIAPDGRAKAIELAKPRFLDHGDVFFSPDGSQLTVAGATDVGADGKPDGCLPPPGCGRRAVRHLRRQTWRRCEADQRGRDPDRPPDRLNAQLAWVAAGIAPWRSQRTSSATTS